MGRTKNEIAKENSNTQKSDYDHIIIGSGPISIIEACYQISLGKKVLVIEENDGPCGAWKTIQHDGIPRVEIGCHIWDIADGVYEFLEKFLKLELMPLSPAPRVLRKGVRFPYDWKLNVMTARGVLRNIKTLNFKQLMMDSKRPNFRVSVRPGKYLYPKAGAKAIEQAVKNLIEQYGIDVKFNTRLRSIHCNDELKVVLANETMYVAQQITMTSLSTVDEMLIHQRSVKSPRRLVNYMHVHLLIKGFEKRNISYDRVMGHKLIHRISDMTSQVVGEIPTGCSLLCVGIFERTYAKMGSEGIEKKVLKNLIDLDYLRGKGTILQWGFNSYPTHYNERKILNGIAKASNHRVSVLYSTNFTYAVHDQLDRWKSLLD